MSDEPAPSLMTLGNPDTVIARFVARRTILSAVFWALAFGVFMASKSIGFVAAYPTAHERAQAVASFSSNVGILAILGRFNNVITVGGFGVWSVLMGISIIGAIWGMMLATKNFRGAEESGRMEILLSGQTTMGRGAANILAGLGSSLLVLFAISAATFIVVGSIHSVDFGVGGALFLAVAATAGAAEFMAFGAFASQIMPTRGRALGLGAAVFGVSFLIRALADTANAHWLLAFTPIGWIEQLQPLINPQPLWLIPIVLMVAILSGLAIYLAGRRDLGASFFADKEGGKAHTALLSNSFLASVRLNLGVILSWLVGITVAAGFYGLLTKTAAQAFAQTKGAEELISKFAHASQLAGANVWLGVVMMLQMLILMGFAASMAAAMREDEAQGYLDNLIVRPLARLRWLFDRIILSSVAIALGGLLTGTAVWAGEASQGTGVSFHTLLLAGINTMVPSFFILAVGIFALGLLPRQTSLVAYGLVAWSFLLELVSSGLNLNHWILDASVLQHVKLAPATPIDWISDAWMVAVALVLIAIGASIFNRRDLSAE